MALDRISVASRSLIGSECLIWLLFLPGLKTLILAACPLLSQIVLDMDVLLSCSRWVLDFKSIMVCTATEPVSNIHKCLCVGTLSHHHLSCQVTCVFIPRLEVVLTAP